jgi:predicted glutamine amidotransferase
VRIIKPVCWSRVWSPCVVACVRVGASGRASCAKTHPTIRKRLYFSCWWLFITSCYAKLTVRFTLLISH